MWTAYPTLPASVPLLIKMFPIYIKMWIFPIIRQFRGCDMNYGCSSQRFWWGYIYILWLKVVSLWPNLGIPFVSCWFFCPVLVLPGKSVVESVALHCMGFLVSANAIDHNFLQVQDLFSWSESGFFYIIHALSPWLSRNHGLCAVVWRLYLFSALISCPCFRPPRTGGWGHIPLCWVVRFHT